MSKLYTLSLNDFQKGLILAVATAFFGVMQQFFIAHGTDFGAYDWGSIVNVVILAFMGYLSKNYFTNSEGKILAND